MFKIITPKMFIVEIDKYTMYVLNYIYISDAITDILYVESSSNRRIEPMTSHPVTIGERRSALMFEQQQLLAANK